MGNEKETKGERKNQLFCVQLAGFSLCLSNPNVP